MPYEFRFKKNGAGAGLAIAPDMILAFGSGDGEWFLG
jgi:hypothetical protein